MSIALDVFEIAQEIRTYEQVYRQGVQVPTLARMKGTTNRRVRRATDWLCANGYVKAEGVSHGRRLYIVRVG